MTRVYFVRHAQPEHDWQEDRTRPLTPEGQTDARAVLDFLKDKAIDAFYCSPYRRSLDTIRETAEYFGQEIHTDERLREREKGPDGNNHGMFQKRWADHDYHEEGGESLRMVQERNMAALWDILRQQAGKNLVIGTHGTALSTILNYFDPEFGCQDFLRIIDWMPYIIELDFDGERLVEKREHIHIEKEFKGKARADQPPSLLRSTGNTRAILPDSLRYIRSDVPANLCQDDIAWLRSNNVRTVIDLREDEERQNRKCVLEDEEDFWYIAMPVTGGDRVPDTPEDVPVTYVNMVDEQMERILRTIEGADTNVLYFCNAGKDRTGVVSALLLRRLGYDNDYIIRDYMQSARNLQEMLNDYAAADSSVDVRVITPAREYMEAFLQKIGDRLHISYHGMQEIS